MTISVFDLFSVGIGPSSSHTVGPMRAAGMFVDELVAGDLVDHVADVRVDLYGSLAATGAGHGTMPAILLGLEGYRPETIETDEMERRLAVIRAEGKIRLAGRIVIALTESDIALHPFRQLDHHPNAMTLTRHVGARRGGLPRDVLLGRWWLRGHRSGFEGPGDRSTGRRTPPRLPFRRRTADPHRT